MTTKSTPVEKLRNIGPTVVRRLREIGIRTHGDIADRAFISDDTLPRTDEEFAKQRDRAKTRLPTVAQGAAKLAADIFTELLIG